MTAPLPNFEFDFLSACWKILHPKLMTQQRWLRIIPVALIMYTISYVDRTNVSLALDPKISNLMRDLFMDDKMKGEAAGIFFFGYVLLQIPGGFLASRWSARKLISLCLIALGSLRDRLRACRNRSGSLNSCGFFWASRRARFSPARWCCWRTGLRARNAPAPTLTGSFASRWPWPAPRR